MGTKRLRIFARPNGSGKTRLHEIIRNQYTTGPYINADIILQSLEAGQFDFSIYKVSNPEDIISTFENPTGILSKSSILKDLDRLMIKGSVLEMNGVAADSYFAGHVAAFAYEQLIEDAHTFSFETVMSDPRKLDMFRAAKEAGYRIYLYFICTEDPQINIARIDQRVAEDGHDVPDATVIKRYSKVFEHLLDAVNLCHRVYFFDNSGEAPVLFAEVEDGQFAMKATAPKWFVDFTNRHERK